MIDLALEATRKAARLVEAMLSGSVFERTKEVSR
jgi:hypothetical protein